MQQTSNMGNYWSTETVSTVAPSSSSTTINDKQVVQDIKSLAQSRFQVDPEFWNVIGSSNKQCLVTGSFPLAVLHKKIQPLQSDLPTQEQQKWLDCDFDVFCKAKSLDDPLLRRIVESLGFTIGHVKQLKSLNKYYSKTFVPKSESTQTMSTSTSIPGYNNSAIITQNTVGLQTPMGISFETKNVTPSVPLATATATTTSSHTMTQDSSSVQHSLTASHDIQNEFFHKRILNSFKLYRPDIKHAINITIVDTDTDLETYIQDAFDVTCCTLSTDGQQLFVSAQHSDDIVKLRAKNVQYNKHSSNNLRRNKYQARGVEFYSS